MKDHGYRRSEKRSRERNQNLQIDNYFNSFFHHLFPEALGQWVNISRSGNAHFCVVSGHTSTVLSNIVDINFLLVIKEATTPAGWKLFYSSGWEGKNSRLYTYQMIYLCTETSNKGVKCISKDLIQFNSYSWPPVSSLKIYSTIWK